jgi:hypothetical protein
MSDFNGAFVASKINCPERKAANQQLQNYQEEKIQKNTSEDKFGRQNRKNESEDQFGR